MTASTVPDHNLIHVSCPYLKHDGDAKYIIVGITDATSKNPREFMAYGFVSIDLYYHSDIFEEYQTILYKQNRSLRATCLGGGIVTVNNTSKTVKTYGTSGGYGSASIDLLRYVVAKAFDGYEPNVTITRYIRG